MVEPYIRIFDTPGLPPDDEFQAFSIKEKKHWQFLDHLYPLGVDFTDSALKLKRNPGLPDLRKSSVLGYSDALSKAVSAIDKVAPLKTEKVKPEEEVAIVYFITEFILARKSGTVDQAYKVNPLEFLNNLYLQPLGIVMHDSTELEILKKKEHAALFDSPAKILFAVQFTIAMLLHHTTPELQKLSMTRLDAAIQDLHKYRVVFKTEELGNGRERHYVSLSSDLASNPKGLEIRLSGQSYKRIKEIVSLYAQPELEKKSPNRVGAAIEISVAVNKFGLDLIGLMTDWEDCFRKNPYRHVDLQDVKQRMTTLLEKTGHLTGLDADERETDLANRVITLADILPTSPGEIPDEDLTRELVDRFKVLCKRQSKNITDAILLNDLPKAKQFLDEWMEESHGVVDVDEQRQMVERVTSAITQLVNGGEPLLFGQQSKLASDMNDFVTTIAAQGAVTSFKPDAAPTDVAGLLVQCEGYGLVYGKKREDGIAIGGMMGTDQGSSDDISIPTNSDIPIFAFKDVFGVFNDYEGDAAKLQDMISALVTKYGPVYVHMSQPTVLPTILNEGGLGTKLDNGLVGIYIDYLSKPDEPINKRLFSPDKPMFIMSKSWGGKTKFKQGNYGYNTTDGVVELADSEVLHLIVPSETLRTNLLAWIKTWGEARFKRTFGNKDPEKFILAKLGDLETM